MKYTTVLLAFAAGVLAQSSVVTNAPSTTGAPAISPAYSCLSGCSAGDVTCQAGCLGNARPNSSQAVETTECAARCDQGDGTAEATQRYSDCVQGCIAKLFPSSQTGSLIPGGAASAAASGSNGASNSAAATGASGAGSSSSPTGSGSGAAQATGAANSISARVGGAGLAGLLAVFAL